MIKSNQSIHQLRIFEHDFLYPAFFYPEIARIGALKGVRVALYGMYCINLSKETAKVLGIQFSYKKKLEEKKNFNNHTAKIENVSKGWKMRDLTIKGKIAIFNSLAIWKIMHLDLTKIVLIFTGEQLNIIIKNFTWQGIKPKIKDSTICKSCENGDLKDVDIF